MKQKILFELPFFPHNYFFGLLAQVDLVIERHENYQKRSFRNKCIIATADGPQTLTVPLRRGKHEQQKITDVKIAYDEPWQRNHLSALHTAYRNAPFFDYYFSKIQELYANSGEFLFEFNWQILLYFTSQVGFPNATCTEDFEKKVTCADFRGIITPRNYAQYLVPKYNQVFEDRHGYLNNLSILDVLFCLGPETSQHLGSTDIHNLSKF